MTGHLDVIRDEVRAMSAYHVPPAAGMVKLDAMENPHLLPVPVRQQMAAALADCALNRYPDPRAEDLKQALRKAMGIPGNQHVLVGNGSDEIIQMMIVACAREGACILAPAPTFVMYRQYALLAGVAYHAVDLAADFTLPVQAMLDAIAEQQPAIVFLSYPNNPTGNLFDTDAIEKIVRAAPGLVVVDEAYQPFADASMLDRLADFPNLVILRTVSKLGLAGIRLGYAVGAADWMCEFEKVRSPYNVNVLTQVAAQVALANYGILLDQSAMIKQERARLYAALERMPALHCHPSSANFLLVRVPDAVSSCAELSRRGILVKSMHGSHPLLDQCIRITVGTSGENDLLLAAMPEVLGDAARGADAANRVV